MSDALRIEGEGAFSLAAELAALTGESLERVVLTALVQIA